MKAPGLIEISAEQCAPAAIQGFDRGRAMIVPAAMMKLVLLLNGLSPRFLRRVVSSFLGKIARRRELGAS